MSTYETPIPGADVYAQAELAAKTGYQNAVARLNQQRQDTLQQYGYLGSVDPTSGALSNLRVDPNNPYGQYQQLLRGGAQEAQTLHDNAVGRGLGGGLAAQGESQAKYDFGAGSFQLGRGLQNTLHQFDSSQTQAQTNEQNSILGAKMQALQAALQAQLIAAQNGSGAAVGSVAPGGLGGGGAPAYSAPGSGPDSGYHPQGTITGPQTLLAPGGGTYRSAGGVVTYQSNKGKLGKKPLQ